MKDLEKQKQEELYKFWRERDAEALKDFKENFRVEISPKIESLQTEIYKAEKFREFVCEDKKVELEKYLQSLYKQLDFFSAI